MRLYFHSSKTLRFFCHPICSMVLWYIYFTSLLFRNYPHVTEAGGPSKTVQIIRLKQLQMNSIVYKLVQKGWRGAAVLAFRLWCLFVEFSGACILRTEKSDWLIYLWGPSQRFAKYPMTLANNSHVQILSKTILCSPRISRSACLGLAGHYLISVPVFQWYMYGFLSAHSSLYHAGKHRYHNHIFLGLVLCTKKKEIYIKS